MGAKMQLTAETTLCVCEKGDSRKFQHLPRFAKKERRRKGGEKKLNITLVTYGMTNGGIFSPDPTDCTLMECHQESVCSSIEWK
jgi:hypothetical protein